MKANTATKILTFLIVVLCLAGVIDASLVLREHYEFKPCSVDEAWNCAGVNHSKYAVIHLPGGDPQDPMAREIPVAMIGIAGYALLAALAGRFPWITALGALAGTAFALRLTWIEWKVLKIWCIYCVVSQCLIAAIFLLAVAAAVVGRRAEGRSA
jgi:vitamin-K-epoxide reductase (warfarin-sensitive)